MRIPILGTMLGSVMLTSVPAAFDWPPVLIWNASASVPIGLYHVQPEEHLAVMDLVVVTPPEPVANFLAEGKYLPRGVPLLKRNALPKARSSAGSRGGWSSALVRSARVPSLPIVTRLA